MVAVRRKEVLGRHDEMRIMMVDHKGRGAGLSSHGNVDRVFVKVDALP